MHDHQDELRPLSWQRAPFSPAGAAPPLVIVAGGLPLVGTTTIAVNLAVAFARQGRRVVFVDADLARGGRAWFGSSTAGSIVDVLAERRGLHETLDRGPSGIQVLCGTWPSGEPREFSSAAQNRVIEDFKHLAPHVELVVVDAGNVRGAFTNRLWQAAGTVVAVTTPADNALAQCYAAIKSHAADLPTVHSLLNQAADEQAAADVHTRLAKTCRRFLGRTTVALGSTESCAELAEHAGIFPSREVPARVLDRAAEILWTHLQEAAPGSHARRAASS